MSRSEFLDRETCANYFMGDKLTSASGFVSFRLLLLRNKFDNLVYKQQKHLPDDGVMHVPVISTAHFD